MRFLNENLIKTWGLGEEGEQEGFFEGVKLQMVSEERIDVNLALRAFLSGERD